MRAGNVPTARVGPIIGELARERWPQGGYEVLAEKVGCDESAIRVIIEQRCPGVEFDLADSIITALGRWDMWHGVLADIYPTKFYETCALHSCNRRFPEKFNGRTRKRYCSPRCATLANAVRRGEATGDRLRQKGYCLNGHKMTPENTIKKWRKRDNKWEHQCRECKRKSQREWMRRKRQDPAFRERAVEKTRQWRARVAA